MSTRYQVTVSMPQEGWDKLEEMIKTNTLPKEWSCIYKIQTPDGTEIVVNEKTKEEH
jgi:hypothetical protein